MRVTRSIAAFCIAVLLIAELSIAQQPFQDGERPRIAFADMLPKLCEPTWTSRRNASISTFLWQAQQPLQLVPTGIGHRCSGSRLVQSRVSNDNKCWNHGSC